MPEHVHLLITEPEEGRPSTVMQVLKQRTARALLPKRKRRDPQQRELFGEDVRRAFWQARFYDFNVERSRRDGAPTAVVALATQRPGHPPPVGIFPGAGFVSNSGNPPGESSHTSSKCF